MDDDTNRFIDWCVENGRLSVVQRDLDRRNALAHGASVFSHKRHFVNDKRRYYREEYLKSTHWKSLRSKKLEHSPACEDCMRSDALDVHHINYRNLFDVTLQDLATLCRECHETEHNLITAYRRIEWQKRIAAAAVWLECTEQYVENMLSTGGIRNGDICLLSDRDIFKFGVFEQAFKTRTKVPLRLAFIALHEGRIKFEFLPLGKTSRKIPSVLLAEYVSTWRKLHNQ